MLNKEQVKGLNHLGDISAGPIARVARWNFMVLSTLCIYSFCATLRWRQILSLPPAALFVRPTLAVIPRLVPIIKAAPVLA